jgi:ribonucleoside-diphosphate reductase alpha chain
MASEMFVVKRDGESEIVSFDKILRRIKRIGQEAGIQINYTQLAMKVIDQLYDKISTAKIDELTAEQCASMSSIHYDYGTLASHITVSNHHKNTESNILTVMRKLYNYMDKHGNHSPLITRELLETIDEHYTAISERIDFKRDYVFDYFGFKTLEKTYLMRINGKVVERPQHMWMRVSLGIHGKDLESALKTYDLMSQKFFTHATPTLFNAGTPRPQLSSCFLLSMENDSIDGIYNTLKDCALISKWAGGIGLHIHNVRATNSHIRGTNGTSNGIVPMLRVFNNTAKYVDQCVDPETIVYSKRGPVKIKNIVVGDEVITDDGNFYPIRKVLDYPNYRGDLHTIEVKHSLYQLLVTDMHPLYVIKNETYIQTKFKRILSALDRKLVAPDFVEAKDVRENDFVGFPIPQLEQDIVHFTEDDCRMYGILVGSDAELSNVCRISFTNLETLKFVETYLQSIGIIVSRFDRDAYKNIVFTSNNMFKFTQEMIRDNKDEKMVLPNMLHLPKNKSIKIIQGLIETSAKFDDNRIKFENTSFNVVESLRYLLLRLGILTSGYMKNRCNRARRRRMIILSIPKKPAICDLFPNVVTVSKSFKFFEHNGYLFSIVKNNKKAEGHEGRVIDIEVDHGDHHNFLTHNGLVHNGGGKRNGSFAIYMEPWHADIEKFLEMRKNHGDEELKARDLFYALWIPDLFMNRVKSNEPWTLMCPDECPGLSDVYGDEFEKLYTKYEAEGKGRATLSARDLWFKVLDAQMETGTPYLCYKDTANNKSNQKNIGVIKSSNLCVAPETTVLTDRGHIRIDTLENQKVNVWNGEEFSEVEIKRTGENQPLIEVHTDDGSVLTCTPYHKFYIQTTFARSKIIQIEAQHLNQGDKIIKFSYPIINGTDDMFYPYTHGFFCGDGTYSQQAGYAPVKCEYKSMESSFFCSRHSFYETENNRYKVYDDTLYCNAISNEKKPKIYLYGEKKKLLQHIKYRTISEYNDRITVELPIDIEDKFYVPLNHSLKCKLDWFSGYCDADGSIARNGENQQLQIASINKDFLLKIKLMLQTCGINSKVKKNRDPGYSSLPDGKGGRALFETKEINRLLITSVDLQKLIKLGFSPHRLVIDTEHILQRAASQFTKIAKIVDNNRVDNTFCFTEPKRHMGIFNGILTGQCSEIMEVSTPKETAVCNLASIGLPTFVETDPDGKVYFNYDNLRKVASVITDNLNKVIDVNYYPTEKTRVSNLRHRPIGIGVQGLADVFMLLDIPFHSDEAKEVNTRIFETIYYGALEKSAELAALHGPYETYGGSPASKGILQFDMWNATPSEHLDWAALKAKIVRSGLRNSLLLAPMPTASTSQILGFNECFEPFTSNIYSRRTMAGEFVLTNKYLMRELIELGIWNTEVKNNIIANQGSVQHIANIPEYLKQKYKTVWEIPMRHVIDMAADRGAFICQSQSLNLWQEDPNYNSLTSMHFYAWSKGLKTGIYYLRRRAKHRAQQFTIEPKKNEECEMCSA